MALIVTAQLISTGLRAAAAAAAAETEGDCFHVITKAVCKLVKRPQGFAVTTGAGRRESPAYTTIWSGLDVKTTRIC